MSQRWIIHLAKHLLALAIEIEYHNTMTTKAIVAQILLYKHH